MILHVHLENWRAYRSFDIDLGEGTTFFVASNGVGKTSFIDAVRWALDPGGEPNWDLMRRRGEDAVVEVKVDAGGTAIRIRKTLSSGRSKKVPNLDLKAWVGDEAADGPRAYAALAEAWQADATFVNRAAFLIEGFHDKGTEPDVHAHLTSLYGLDHLQQAISVLTPAVKRAMDEADETRKSADRTAAAVEQASAAAAETEAAVAEAEAHAESLRGQVERLGADVEAARRAVAERAAYASWLNGRDRLLAEIEELLGPVEQGSPLLGIVRAAEAAARQQLAELSEQRARLAARMAAIEESLVVLREAGGECPVCRRTLDDDSRALAEIRHRHDQEAAVAAASTVDVDEPTALLERLVVLARRVEALGDDPQAPEGSAPDVDALVEQHRVANEEFEVALGELGGARELKRSADRALLAAREAADAPSSVALYTKAAALESAKAALEGTISTVLGAQMDPVQDEVNRRWEIVFPDRPGLKVDSRATIDRSFDVDDRDVPFRSFSAGERVVSKLLLRLATLSSTTNIPFCWVDEPLEHLDPDARRYVARTLAHMSKSDVLRQIFVTTYEEDLAMRLTVEQPDDVRLIFLRTATAAL